MLLRRIMSHLSEQNWFAVLLDLLVVIIGILLAMQLNEWNQLRKDGAKEQLYLEAFYNDFKHNVEEAQGLMEQHQELSGRSKDIAAYLIRGVFDATEEEQLTGQRTGMRIYPSAKYQMTTLNEMVSTGSLNLISDQPLRRAIQNFADQTRQVEQQLEHFRRSVVITLGNAPVTDTHYTLDEHGNISSRKILRSHLNDKEQISVFSASAGTHFLFSMFRREELNAAKTVLNKLSCILEKPECSQT